MRVELAGRTAIPIGQTPTPFVGRDAECRVLADAVHAACAGAGRLVLIAGEPGIGKTTLVREALRRVEAERLAPRPGSDLGRDADEPVVLWGRCVEGEGAPPFWPWTHALRGYALAHDADDLEDELGVLGVPSSTLQPPERSVHREMKPQLLVLDVRHERDARAARGPARAGIVPRQHAREPQQRKGLPRGVAVLDAPRREPTEGVRRGDAIAGRAVREPEVEQQLRPDPVRLRAHETARELARVTQARDRLLARTAPHLLGRRAAQARDRFRPLVRVLVVVRARGGDGVGIRGVRALEPGREARVRPQPARVRHTPREHLGIERVREAIARQRRAVGQRRDRRRREHRALPRELVAQLLDCGDRQLERIGDHRRRELAPDEARGLEYALALRVEPLHLLLDELAERRRHRARDVVERPRDFARRVGKIAPRYPTIRITKTLCTCAIEPIGLVGRLVQMRQAEGVVPRIRLACEIPTFDPEGTITSRHFCYEFVPLWK
ncbi:MAG TPA: ATP-binding protein [Candidatus Binatia bacterium]